MQINLIKTTYNNFDNIPKLQGQLLYATDTKNAVYDLDNNIRYSLSCTRQYDTDFERTSITNPEENILYIVVQGNKMYRYYNDLGWVNIVEFDAAQDILISAEELVSMVIENDGIKYAPQTLAKYIFMNDGSTLQSAIDDLMQKGTKVVLESKTMPIQLVSDKQKIVDIPYPITDYNIYKFPMFVLLRNDYVSKDKYAIGSQQLIFSDDIANTNKKDDVVTFIFVYAHSLADVTLDCQSINGTRWFIGNTDLALDLRQDGDVMVNTYYGEMKRWNVGTQEWSLIFSNRKRLIKRIENTVSITTPTNYIPIGISGYDKNKDTLIVFKNGVHLYENKDFVLSGDYTFIKAPNGFTWDVSSKTPTTFYFLVLKNLPSNDYDEYDDDNFDGNALTNLRSEISELRAQVLDLKDTIYNLTNKS